MAKHTRRRGGTWYDPRTWFSSSSAPTEESQSAPANTQSDFGVGSPTPSSSPSPFGGRKGKKSRRNKRRGTKSRRKH